MLSNYLVNMINGDSENEHQSGQGVSCFCDIKSVAEMSF